MSRLGPVALLLWCGLVALGALGFLHGTPRLGQWAVGTLAGWGIALVLHTTWASLPRFVTSWLAAGTGTVGVLVAAVGTVVGKGPAYAVLRGPELLATLGSAGLLGSAVAALAYTHRRLAREVARQEQRVAELRRRALESHLAALSAQINPHFLFNTLNTLAEVVHEDAGAAEALVTDLAHMMRYALRSTSRWVPLGEELEVVRRLFRLEAARLGDRLRWSVDVEPAAAEVEVPGLLVQPLVENAVRYAVADRVEGGTVTVAARREGGRLHVVVEDDGPGLPPEIARELHAPGRGTEGAGGGLYTTAERVRLAWPHEAGTLEAVATDRGTRLRIDVPVGTKGRGAP